MEKNKEKEASKLNLLRQRRLSSSTEWFFLGVLILKKGKDGKTGRLEDGAGASSGE